MNVIYKKKYLSDIFRPMLSQFYDNVIHNGNVKDLYIYAKGTAILCLRIFSEYVYFNFLGKSVNNILIIFVENFLVCLRIFLKLSH